ncbi:DciA family protein [Streptomyces sp. bgisy060]|uniref:DciA family protein n=1 Tax=Streptomyces sp. bgisy060 TaxID=3413775 RepID=UPI003EB8FA90
MSAVPELSGVDLARQALLAAREAAKKNGAQTKKPKRRTGTTLRRDGREPLGLGAAITMMMTERGLVAPAAGGSVLAQWETILAATAPELAGHVQAVKFDADTGRLDVAPDAPAYGTKVRWIAPKLIAAANQAAGRTVVNSLRILPPGAAPIPAPEEPAPAAPTGPVKTRGTASEGYRRAPAGRRRGQGGDRVATELNGVEFTRWSLPTSERDAEQQPGPKTELSSGVAGGLAWPGAGHDRAC